ncbi:MAG TPA: choice-of-anchor tandem repeat GloVer-containing protein, partial [Candidatus Baltobacteraceae bacterium]|nr:choice-of-anchor tandem repeat GloVer-containing protein [Candidatus Baltobacteraceae bacterium]
SLGCGTVFSVTTTGSEKVLHSFAEGSDGQGPSAPLIDVNGTLYGTTYYGGGNSRCNLGCGTVFALSP